MTLPQRNRNRYRTAGVVVGMSLGLAITVLLALARPEPITAAGEGSHLLAIGGIFLPALVISGLVLGLRAGDTIYRRRVEKDQRDHWEP